MNRIIRRSMMVLFALSLLGIGVHKFSYPRVVSAQAKAPTDWEPTIKKFEDQDKVDPPKQGEIVFTGASSIVRWKTLQEDMAPLYVINRGFGGSQYSDANKYAKRIVAAYHPRAVVVYEGDNDLAEGSPKTPEQVANDAKEFIKIVHDELPQTWIYVMSIKPSVLRWNQWPNMKAANALMAEYIKAHPDHLQLLDISTPMFDADGNLPRDLFVEDGLHPTPKLYAMWTSVIKPVLMKKFGPGKMSGQNLGTAPNFVFGVQNVSAFVAR
jgi:lysophospholipase L1-like esterase